MRRFYARYAVGAQPVYCRLRTSGVRESMRVPESADQKRNDTNPCRRRTAAPVCGKGNGVAGYAQPLPCGATAVACAVT